MAENKATAAPEPSQGQPITTNNTDNGSEQQTGLGDGRTMARRAIDKNGGKTRRRGTNI